MRDARERLSHEMSRREFAAALGLGLGFVVVAVAMAAVVPHHRSPSLLTALVLVAAYAASSQVEFEIGAGCAVPTELVLVPMLFLLPAGIVPLCVAAGLLAGAVADHVRQRMHPARMLLVLPNAWHAVGPALVFAAAGVGSPAWQDWPVYAAALAAQFGLDFLSSAGANWFGHGVPPRESVRFLAWVYLVDVLLAPLGVVAAHHGMLSFLPALPLLALFAVFARERRGRIDQTIELSSAYRGTALLLGDVIEADDAYTGSHSRDVVELAVAVADRLRLDPRARRDVEFAALLHDVGKIHVPTGSSASLARWTPTRWRSSVPTRSRGSGCSSTWAGCSLRSARSCAPATSISTGMATQTDSPARRSPSRRGSSAHAMPTAR